jgi:hypothetical protein
MAKRPSDKPTSAQLRGDIDRGKTGDKTPGVDPAAAPMETDAEASGMPPTPEEVAQARALERHGIEGRRNAAAPEKAPDGG